MKNLLNQSDVQAIIDIALREDIGSGDHSSLACIGNDKIGNAYCLAKDNGIICGLDLAAYIFNKVDSSLQFNSNYKDGDEIKIGDVVFTVVGKSKAILTAERLVLNFMQRLSGVASQSKKISSLLNGFNTKVLDTRKTTPGMRLFEKYAVKIGGSFNHRIGLYDMIMLKDNHIDFAGGIKQAIEKTHDYLKEHNLNLSIEVETRNLDEVKQVMDIGGIQRIMLDNFTPELLKEAVVLINGKFETEASGGITIDTIKEFAATGVDFISVGALTHSAKSIDLSLKVN